ncbi:hypothetical protein KR222_011821, partial [Zaprionus bogoriensis]
PELSHPDKWMARNVGFACSHVMKGRGMGIVIACGDDSEVGIMGRLSMGPRPISRTRRHMNQIMGYTYVVEAVMTLMLLIAMRNSGYTLLMTLELCIGMALALAPQYLPILMFFGLWHLKQNLLQQGCLVRNMEAASTLGRTSVICCSPMGSLTVKEWRVSEVFVEGRLRDVSTIPVEAMSTVFVDLLKVSVLCSDAVENSGQRGVPLLLRTIYGSPSDVAMLKYAMLVLNDVHKLRREHELLGFKSYNDIEGLHVTVHCAHRGTGQKEYLLLMKGHIDRVLRRCNTHALDEQNQRVALEPQSRLAILQGADRLSNMARYIYGFGHCVLSKEEYEIIAKVTQDFRLNDSAAFGEFIKQHSFQLHFMGFLAVYDPPYANVDRALDRCRSAGIKLVLLTRASVKFSQGVARLVGAIGETVEEVASRLSIHESQVKRSMVTAAVVHLPNWKMDEHHQRWETRQLLLAHQDIVVADVAVMQNHMIVEVCQELGAVVTVTGSSVHSTSAIRRANVGVAEGASSEACQHCADLILVSGNFVTLVDAIAESRLFFENMKKAFAYALSSNLAMILIHLAAYCLGLPFRLFLVVSLLLDIFVNMVLPGGQGNFLMHGLVLTNPIRFPQLPALSLFYETSEVNQMMQKPRIFEDSLITVVVFLMAFLQVGIIEASGVFLIYFVQMGHNGFLPRTLIGLQQQWCDEANNDVLDSYGQEWSTSARQHLDYQVSSATMFTITVMQCVNLVMTKTGRTSLIAHGFKNTHLNIAVFYLICLAILVCFVDSPKYLRIVPANNYLVYLMYLWPLLLLNIFLECSRRYLLQFFPSGWLSRNTLY